MMYDLGMNLYLVHKQQNLYFSSNKQVNYIVLFNSKTRMFVFVFFSSQHGNIFLKFCGVPAHCISLNSSRYIVFPLTRKQVCNTCFLR